MYSLLAIAFVGLPSLFLVVLWWIVEPQDKKEQEQENEDEDDKDNTDGN
jgi:cbb3-type cytochrome oxidase subunit 3